MQAKSTAASIAQTDHLAFAQELRASLATSERAIHDTFDKLVALEGWSQVGVCVCACVCVCAQLDAPAFLVAVR